MPLCRQVRTVRQNHNVTIFAIVLTVRNTEHFRIEHPSIVTIGTFDGVHLGHQKILARLGKLRQSTGLQTVVLTFDPHPRKVLFPEQKDLKLLTTTDEKLDLLRRHNVDVSVVYPFTRSFSMMSSDDYVKDILIRSLHVKYLVIGYDHRFGNNRCGDIGLLRKYAPSSGFEVEEISARDIDSIAISSSRIRKALEEGDLERATEFLGHSYSLSGRVVRGKQLGRELGYPTANIEVTYSDKLIPAKGIYFAEVVLGGEQLFGMRSVGSNPTSDTDEALKLEVHIFDFNTDIYGKTLEVTFVKRLRDEKKFDSLEQLKQALLEDKQSCLRLMAAAT